MKARLTCEWHTNALSIVGVLIFSKPHAQQTHIDKHTLLLLQLCNTSTA